MAKVPVRGLAVAGGEGVGELLGAHAVDGHGEVAAEKRRSVPSNCCDENTF